MTMCGTARDASAPGLANARPSATATSALLRVRKDTRLQHLVRGLDLDLGLLHLLDDLLGLLRHRLADAALDDDLLDDDLLDRHRVRDRRAGRQRRRDAVARAVLGHAGRNARLDALDVRADVRRRRDAVAGAVLGHAGRD